MSISGLSELVSAVSAIDPEEYGPLNVGRMLAELRLKPHDVTPYLHFKKGTYTRNLIFRNSNFEALILCWDAGVSSPVHDHAGQHCWFTTLEGSFDIDEYRRLSGGRCEGYAQLEQTGRVLGVRAGQPDYRYRGIDIHRVSTSPDQPSAVSLHIYAKPLSTCLVYDCETNRCLRRDLTYDTVSVEKIAIPALSPITSN